MKERESWKLSSSVIHSPCPVSIFPSGILSPPSIGFNSIAIAEFSPASSLLPLTWWRSLLSVHPSCARILPESA